MELASDEVPLEQGHVPEKVANRDSETQQLTQTVKQLYNIHLHGPHGTRETHLTKKTLEKTEIKVCYLSCIGYDIQYRTLRKIYLEPTGESIGTGHYTFELQRKIKEGAGAVETIIVLDELDSPLLNGGSDLLYFPSCLETNDDPGLVLIIANHQDFEEQVEPRTYSTPQPWGIGFESYTGEQTYEVLADRASKNLKPRTVHRTASTYIASSTQNTGYTFTWFRTVVNNADDIATGELIRRLQERACSLYIENQLLPLSQHHKILCRAIAEISQESEPVVNTGSVYNRYETTVDERGSTPLSGRRINDYLKQLEQLNLISADYHYGGGKGKAREIRLTGLQ